MARTQDDSRTPVKWAFINHAGKWTWRQLKMDGSIERGSPPLPDFGAAVSHALKHGFLPKGHHWVVTNKSWTTHFQPGHVPEFHTPEPTYERPQARLDEQPSLAEQRAN